MTIVLAVLAASALGACGGSSGEKSRTSTGKQHPAGQARANPHYGAPGATVSFLAPKQGSTIADPVHVKVAVKGFKLDPTGLDKAPRQGKGNLQFRMDEGKYDTPRYSGANGRLAERLGVARKFSPALRPEITYTGLPPGTHTLVVSLANNDLSQTGVHASVVFSVR